MTAGEEDLKRFDEPEEGAPDDSADTTLEPPDVKKGGPRCPKCRYRPKASDRWSCVCQHSWNTFDTRGRCPACGYQWDDTACPACGKWSKHVDWYEPAVKKEP